SIRGAGARAVRAGAQEVSKLVSSTVHPSFRDEVRRSAAWLPLLVQAPSASTSSNFAYSPLRGPASLAATGGRVPRALPPPRNLVLHTIAAGCVPGWNLRSAARSQDKFRK